MSDKKFICPIGLTPIKIFGITVIGTLYEKDNITEWFKKSSVDPLTNIVVPSTFVKTLDNNRKNRENIQDICNDMKNSTMSWKRSLLYVFDSPKKHIHLLKIQHNIDELKDLNRRAWNDYNKYKRSTIINFDSTEEQDDLIDRPNNSGGSFQFIDLSNLSIRGCMLKLCKFDFANLTNTEFIDCNLAGCSFIRSNLTNCTFKRCNLTGDNVSFYNALTIGIAFYHCKFEFADTWKSTTYSSDIEKILKERGIKNSCLIFGS